MPPWATDGVVIGIADRAVAFETDPYCPRPPPIAGTSAFTRSLLQLGNGARATLVESFHCWPAGLLFVSGSRFFRRTLDRQ